MKQLTRYSTELNTIRDFLHRRAYPSVVSGCISPIAAIPRPLAAILGKPRCIPATAPFIVEPACERPLDGHPAKPIPAIKQLSGARLGDGSLSENVESVKSRFDWVARRSACTLPKIYKTLRADVEEDITERNSLRPDDASYEFSIAEKENAFSVVLQAKEFQRSVTFALEEHAILVLDPSGNQMFEVTVNFNDEGKCRLKAKEQNRELWQVRRMALEDLLFRIF